MLYLCLPPIAGCYTAQILNTEPAAGIFTPRREIIHCRLAMLGFAGLLFLETKSGVVFF